MHDSTTGSLERLIPGQPPEVTEAPRRHQDVPKVYVAESGIHGRGVFAARHFTAGEFIGIYRGTPTMEDDTYVLWLYEDGEWRGVDGTGVLRFLNHSHEPNAEFDSKELYALHDIRPGEEITFHYGEEWEDPPDDQSAGIETMTE